ncbi:hypothetical protein O3Q52_34930 [Streptomyces sp. ActVer]|uniref:hypothetical protein n=1 Tax=Streptomyces sp. ActVer TaxID=3014558 RepID=UPI0022B355E3|nr:hypothetical protein [Streptomyces sp. ActVer]MCZ4513261.1 hypothetical protein [Streptomyces sp. ActVer]
MPDMSASLALTHLVPLAKEIDENKVTPGVLGFIVFAVMALAVWGLMKSMNRQLGRVDFTEEVDPKTATSEPEPAGSAGSGGKASPAKG